MKCTTRSEAIKRYGQIDIAHQIWHDRDKWMKLLEIPPELTGDWRVFGQSPVKHIYCNIDIHEPLMMALKDLHASGLTKFLKTFDGSFNIRAVRGSTAVSAHAYGLAIDINAGTNKLGQNAGGFYDHPEFVKCFTDQNFDWGGGFQTRRDPMHFSFCWESTKAQEAAMHLA